MEQWYHQYWSQTWYMNTYLVNKANQIGQAMRKRREWNSIYDSGCHFTCLAMIIGIDPARLASELSIRRFFGTDRSIRAKYVSGKRAGLVWDRNAPRLGCNIDIHDIWCSARRSKTTIAIKLKEISKTRNLEKAIEIVQAARAKGLHVVCGPNDHSHLVAGVADGEYFIWDPDPADERGSGKWTIADITAGRVRLRDIFCESQGQIELWNYEMRSSEAQAVV